MIEDYFILAFKNLKKRKIRSLLTVLGIFLAILTIFVLLSLSLGLNEFVNEQFDLLGVDKFFIQPKGQLGAPGTGGAVELTLRDVEIIEKVKGVETVSYFAVGNTKIEFEDKARYYITIGMPIEDSKLIDLIFESSGLGMDEGRTLKKGDKNKVMVGYNYKHKNLFDKPVRTREVIELNDIEFEVIGILEEVGNPGDDQQVYISFEDFKELFNSGNRVDYIMIQVKPGEDLKKVAEQTEKKLTKARDVNEKTIDFSVLTPEELLSIFGNVLNILTAFLVGIAVISLLVGGIGVANTMYASVLERTKEIGTMKAIGAKNSNILFIFLIESGLLGLVGGLSGVGIGIIIAKSIEYVTTVYIGSGILRASMNPLIICGALAFSFIIGTLSGVLPALQASRLKPVDALRYE